MRMRFGFVRVALPLVVVLAAALLLLLLLPPGQTLWSNTLGISGTVETGSAEAPGDLTCDFLSHFNAQLAWSPAAILAPEGYRIYHDGPFWHDDFELVGQVATPATTYDEVRPSFFRHRWYVTSFLGPWESAASNVMEAYCRPAISYPGPCGLGSENRHSERVVKVTWEPAAEAVFYGVFRADQSGGPYEMAGTTENTVYEDTAVRDGITYYYVVVAVDRGGNESDPSLEIAVPDGIPVDSPTGTPIMESTPPPTATAAPTETSPREEPTATATASTGSVVAPAQLTCARLSLFERRLEWLPGSHADRYVLYHDGPFGSDAFEEVAQVDSPATTYDDVLPSFFRHRWYVASMVGAWESGSSHTVEVHCRPTVYFPAPRGLSGSSHDWQRTVTLTWEPLAGAVYHGVFRAAHSGGPYEMVALVERAGYGDDAVSEGVTYYYVVVALDADGNESDPSDELAVAYVAPTPSPSPTPTEIVTATPSTTPEASATATASP